MAGAIQINSTEIISESGGTVTLKNVTTDSSADISASLSSLYATQSQVQGTHTTFNGSHSDGTTTINLASVSGITAGDYVVGEGITPGTTVSSVGASSIVISNGLDTDTVGIAGGESISFYTNSKTLSPGLVAGGLCRGWVNFDGTGTVAIRASYNVASITDRGGSGKYTVNFLTAMPDENYATLVTSQKSGAIDDGYIMGGVGTNGQTSSAVEVTVQLGTAGPDDLPQISVAIFR